MARNQTEFGISFRGLLVDAMQALGWPKPSYYEANFEKNRAVLVLLRGTGPNACLFKGEASRNLAESEEQAAEQAIDFLVQKKQIVVQDVNLERREMYKACCQFYKKKKKALENAEPGRGMCGLSARKTIKVSVPACVPKTVLADLWGVWLEVVAAYQVEVDEMDFISHPDGRHTCCFTIRWPAPSTRERYFIGDSSATFEEARHSVARKAINYVQSLYGFSVKDANFNRMRYADIQCSFQRTGYLAAKEKHVCLVADLESVPVFLADGYSTPEGPQYGIRAGLSMPPPPKRCRTSQVAVVGETAPSVVGGTFGGAASGVQSGDLQGFASAGRPNLNPSG